MTETELTNQMRDTLAGWTNHVMSFHTNVIMQPFDWFSGVCMILEYVFEFYSKC